MIRTLQQRPTQPLSPRTGGKLVQVHAMSAQERHYRSASRAGPGVGEWLRNDLGLVLVYDISDMGFMDDGHRVPCDSSTRLSRCMREMHSLAVSRNHAMPLVLRR